MNGEMLRNLRDSAGLTQEELANEAKITPIRLSRIETGKVQLMMDDYLAIMGALGLMPGDYLPNSGAVRPQVRPLVNRLSEIPDTLLAPVLMGLEATVSAHQQTFATLSRGHRDVDHKDAEPRVESSAPLPIVMPSRVRRSKVDSRSSGSTGVAAKNDERGDPGGDA